MSLITWNPALPNCLFQNENWLKMMMIIQCFLTIYQVLGVLSIACLIFTAVYWNGTVISFILLMRKLRIRLIGLANVIQPTKSYPLVFSILVNTIICQIAQVRKLRFYPYSFLTHILNPLAYYTFHSTTKICLKPATSSSASSVTSMITLIQATIILWMPHLSLGHLVSTLDFLYPVCVQ